MKTCLCGGPNRRELAAAAALHPLIKTTLGGRNMWVTASKLCARKRPRLIPVRDPVIVTGLGLPNTDFRVDLQIIGAVMGDDDIRACLRYAADVVDRADPDRTTRVASIPLLRLLDTALWMRWSVRGRRATAKLEQARA